MMVKHMPFWFFDLKRTEDKLSAYAEKGLYPVDFKAVGRFILEEREPAKVRFRIVQSKKCNGSVPGGVIEKGWVKDCGCKNYYIVHKDGDSVESMPSYKSHINAYRVIQAVCFFVICYALGNIIGFTAAILDDPKPENPGAVILTASLPFIVVILIFSLVCYFIHRSNRKLLNVAKSEIKLDFTIPEENFIYTKEQEKQMLKSGEMKKKYTSTWICAPDKAEAWIEKMAAEGWKFYRLSKWGDCFYFVKSEPCKLKFCVDYQKQLDDEYISSVKDGGWKLEFVTVTRIEGYCIWSKEYTDDDDVPEFYSDSESALEHAKKYFFSMVLPMLLMVALYILIMIDIFVIDGFRWNAGQIIMIILGGFIIGNYGYFSVSSLFYVIRLKNKNKTNVI